MVGASRVVVLGLALLFPLGARAQAEGSIKWSDCEGAGGLGDMRFGCDTNSGAHDLILTLASYGDLRISAVQIELRLAAAGGDTLSPWWDFSPLLGCRRSALEISTDFTDPPVEAEICEDLWRGGVETSLLDFQFAGPRYAILKLALALPPGLSVNLEGGREYLGCRLRIRNNRTVDATPGPLACDGCGRRVCISVERVAFVRPDGSEVVDWGGTSVGWQGAGVYTHVGCQ